MKITILNGNDDASQAQFDNYLQELAQTLRAQGHEVNCIALREREIHFCVGCFGCWVKKPGECLIQDDIAEICRAAINSDFLLWAAPLKLGFPSALLKKTMDRMISLVHPYMEMSYHEVHHRPRYDTYPRLGLLLQREPTSSDADLAVVTDIFARTALNMKSRLEFSQDITTPVPAVARLIQTPEGSQILFEPHPKATTGVKIEPPSRLTLFNGSPRGPKGNTPLLLHAFQQGFTQRAGCSTQMIHLTQQKDPELLRQAFAEAGCVLLAFPLYTDSMPGLVKAFIETLEPLAGLEKNPPLGFLVQSGFPEGVQSRHVERYLERLAGRLGCTYLGTIVKGGIEGIQAQTPTMTQKLFARFTQLGYGLAETGSLDPELLGALAKPESIPDFMTPLLQWASKLPVINASWDGMLKENGVYEQRFARPYRD